MKSFHDTSKLDPLEMTQGQLMLEVNRLRELIRTPHTEDFLDAVMLEAAFQVDHWGTAHDAGKQPEDFYWLVGHLAGKALRAAAIDNNTEKALHHTISTAAVLYNWYRRIKGEDQLFQPGTDQGDLPLKP